MNLLPIDRLGVNEAGAGLFRFGVLLPWISPSRGYRVSVGVTHAEDLAAPGEPWRVFDLRHREDPRYGDCWTTCLRIDPTDHPTRGSAWGRPGNYLYRYRIQGPDGREADGLLDPFARESGPHGFSSFTLGDASGHRWSAAEAGWRTPALEDLVVYELLVSTFAVDLRGTLHRLDHLADLGVTAIELMPIVQAARPADYLPLSHFAVDGVIGRAADLKRLVDAAHQRGMAVILDVVCSHTGSDFPYLAAYRKLGFEDNPLMGPFARQDFGPGPDFRKSLTRDYFLTANAFWLDEYHVDGFRYDFVPGFWDGPTGRGFAQLAYHTHRLVAAKAVEGGPWARFRDERGPRLIQCAEDLERPEEVLGTSFANCIWQTRTLDAARGVARGARRRIADLGLCLGAWGFPSVVDQAGVSMRKMVVHYLENHDHGRFPTYLPGDDGCADGRLDPAGSELNRLRPYLIALFTAKGIPLLWQGQELGSRERTAELSERRSTPLIPVDWSLASGEAGRQVLELVRRLSRLRREHAELRRGEHYFHDQPARYQSRGLLLFSRFDARRFSLVAINFGDLDRRTTYRFPRSGDYCERLRDGRRRLCGVGEGEEREIEVPAHFGCLWALERHRGAAARSGTRR